MNLSNGRQRGNLALWGTFLFCLTPFLLAAFFNLLTTDDYILAKNLQDRGWLLTQQDYMVGWTGRYTAIFIESLLMEAGASHWPFLHTWALLAATWAAIYFLLITVNARLLDRHYARRLLALGAAVLLLVLVYVQAEIGTGLYWFSSAIPYQLAFILLLLLAAFLIRSNRAVSALLIILIAGCNEIAATFQILLLFILLGEAWRRTRSVNRSLLFYLLIAIAAGLLIVSFSGLFHSRYKILRSNAGYITVFPIVVYRSLSVFYFIAKVPLFWIASLTLYLAGATHPRPALPAAATTAAGRPTPADSARPVAARKPLLSGLLIATGLMFLTLFAIVVVTRGPLPQRALNNLIDLTTVGFLALSFVAGSLYKPKTLPKTHPLVLSALLICTMLAAEPVADAWASCFNGYFYSAAEKAREQQIRLAAAANQRTVELPPFQESLDQQVRRVFPHGTFATVRDWLQISPPFLYFAQHSDDACRTYAIYCGLDSVNIQKNR